MDIEDGRLHGKDVIIKLAGINTPEEARLLTGKLIAITRSQLPALDQNEYYWSDLIGLTVVNKDGTVYGKVAYLIETGSNDVLVVKGDKEHAIPYLYGSVVLNVDLEKQQILVDWELL
jgi:16S rRNA processing protein RimM